MAMKKGNDSFYDTFDSGKSKVIPDSESYDHKDDGKGKYTSNSEDKDDADLYVPETPSKKR